MSGARRTDARGACIERILDELLHRGAQVRHDLRARDALHVAARERRDAHGASQRVSLLSQQAPCLPPATVRRGDAAEYAASGRAPSCPWFAE